VKDALLSRVEPTQNGPGCVCYNLRQSKATLSLFTFYEHWANEGASTRDLFAEMVSYESKISCRRTKERLASE